ncbi:MAG: 2-amino-4-hydroxy-6-hydroxymethyldihydropteridine diphosphokinase [Gammaproteobacteria bacterium]|nr:2-amino-4-hydroxy-6-hydroxymethyldihydropteridine diphosphokinase [Gammaproteobacteria bacterium]
MRQRFSAETGNRGIEVFLGVGSNLDSPLQQITRAFSALQALPDSWDFRCSPLYRSPPMGPQDQPDYINTVISLVTRLVPITLLRETQAIEQAHGRVRGVRWGPRTLDIDLLVYGDLILDTPELQLPHPGIAQRAFVLCPLSDIAPDLIIPGVGRVSDLVGRVSGGDTEMIGNPIDIRCNGAI